MEHGKDEMECQGHEEELANLQPLKMKEALAERVLEQVVVAGLDKGDEHGALPSHLVRYENFVVQLDLTVHIIDIMLRQRDGVVQHVLKLRQYARYLPVHGLHINININN